MGRGGGCGDPLPSERRALEMARKRAQRTPSVPGAIPPRGACSQPIPSPTNCRVPQPASIQPKVVFFETLGALPMGEGRGPVARLKEPVCLPGRAGRPLPGSGEETGPGPSAADPSGRTPPLPSRGDRGTPRGGGGGRRWYRRGKGAAAAEDDETRNVEAKVKAEQQKEKGPGRGDMSGESGRQRRRLGGGLLKLTHSIGGCWIVLTHAHAHARARRLPIVSVVDPTGWWGRIPSPHLALRLAHFQTGYGMRKKSEGQPGGWLVPLAPGPVGGRKERGGGRREGRRQRVPGPPPGPPQQARGRGVRVFHQGPARGAL